MILLAHRGNLRGAEPQLENIPARIDEALQLGFGIETDIRRSRSGDLYISHDTAFELAGRSADDHALLWRQFPEQPIALNVKETGYASQLVEFLSRHDLLSQVFLFDFELIEEHAGQMAREIRSLHPGVRLAARVSDRYGETIVQALAIECAGVVWLDEFDSLWACRRDVERLKAAGREVYAISPEIHGFPPEAARRRWREFLDWGVDGICTDDPVRAEQVLGLDGKVPRCCRSPV